MKPHLMTNITNFNTLDPLLSECFTIFKPPYPSFWCDVLYECSQSIERTHIFCNGPRILHTCLPADSKKTYGAQYSRCARTRSKLFIFNEYDDATLCPNRLLESVFW